MLPSLKVLSAAGVSVTNGGTATLTMGPFDGVDAATIVVFAGTADVVSNKPTVLKLQEADVTNTSSFVDISGAVGGTDFTIANALTSNPNNSVFALDMRKRKRYIRALASPQTTQVFAAVALCGRLEQAAINASKAGAQNYVEL